MLVHSLRSEIETKTLDLARKIRSGERLSRNDFRFLERHSEDVLEEADVLNETLASTLRLSGRKLA